MKSRATKDDEKYLETEDFWKYDFEVVWQDSQQRFKITNKHTNKVSYTRCMTRAFKVCYLAKQWLSNQKLDDAPADVLEQVADLVETSIIEINKHMLSNY